MKLGSTTLETYCQNTVYSTDISSPIASIASANNYFLIKIGVAQSPSVSSMPPLLSKSGKSISNVLDTRWYDVESERGQKDSFPSPSCRENAEEYYAAPDDEEKQKTQYMPFPNNIAWTLDKAKVPNVLFSSHIQDSQVRELLPGRVSLPYTTPMYCGLFN